jgi:hypothetical protein
MSKGMEERDRSEFFYCEKDDSFISKEKFPPEKTGFLRNGPEKYICPICEKPSDEPVEKEGENNGEEE